MKFKLPVRHLIKPLTSLIATLEKKNTMAILSNVLIKAEGKQISLTATDLSIELIASIGAEVMEPGTATTSGRKLLDICRSLPEDSEPEFSITDNRNKLVIKSGRSNFSLATMPADDFPNMKKQVGVNVIELPQSQLLNLLKRTYFAMANQDVRYFLNGLLLEVTDKYMRAVSTDGHRLAMVTINVDFDIPGKSQTLIPRKAVLEIMRLLENTEDKVKLSLGGSHLCIELPGFIFTTLLLTGRYPDYNRVIPPEGQNICQANRDLLYQTLSRAAILSNEKNRGVVLNISKSNLKVTANNTEQEKAIDEIDVNYDGDAQEIGFQVNYLLDALSVIESEKTQVAIAGNKCAVLKPVGESDSVYVVMPFKL